MLSLVTSENATKKSYSELDKKIPSNYRSPVIVSEINTTTFLPGPPHPMIMNSVHKTRTNSIQNFCPCRKMVTCPPCGLVNPAPAIECPCAPKPKCQICPPLSLIHEIAAKKVN